MDYKIIPYSSKYLQSLTQLLDTSFGILGSDKEEVVLWKYFHKFHAKKSITYIAIDSKGEVVSHYTNFPITATRKNDKLKACICADMTTANSHRGIGLISALSKKVYKDVEENGYSFSIGYSNDSGIKVDKHSKGYQYIIVGKIVRYIKIALVKNRLNYEIVPIRKLTLQNLIHTKIEYITYLKDFAYLNWRYFDKPNMNYDFYSVKKEGMLLAVIVLRFVNRKCYVMEIITQDFKKELVKDCIKIVENICINKKTRIIIFNVLYNKYWKSIFNRFDCLKMTLSKANHYLTIRIHDKALLERDFSNKEMWIIQGGDIL